MLKAGSDKGLSTHNYTTFYNMLFESLIDDEINLFEVGIGTNNPNLPSSMGPNGIPGASLYGWEEFFIKGQIFAGDIDRNILFQTERIKTFYCNQLDSKTIKEMYDAPELKNVSFDVVIDDGLHTFQANLSFLANSLEKLKTNGIFIIEDLNPITKQKFSKILSSLKKRFNLRYITILHIPGSFADDNCLLVIQK